MTKAGSARWGFPDNVRFWFNVDPGIADDECWIWRGSRDKKGYGKFAQNDPVIATVRAPRWAYESEVGPIPEGLQLDHLCRVTSCVNPAHLEPVTAGENMRRKPFPSRRLVCGRGHWMTPENTIWSTRQRACRICTKAAADRKLLREKEARRVAREAKPVPVYRERPVQEEKA